MIVALLLALGPGCAHRAAAPVADVQAPAPAPTLDPAVRAALEAGAADLDVGVRRAALAALVATEPAPAGGAWALRGRYDPSEYVRRAVIEALADRRGEPETRALLRAVVDDPASDPWSRGAAALLLVDGKVSGVVPADEHEADRARIVAAATSARGARAAALLFAAARLGDAPPADRLRELLAAGNLPMELWFVRALGAAPDAGLTPSLAAAVDVAEPELRLPLAAALLELGDPTGERILAEALTADEDAALEALDYLAEARQRDRALALLKGAALAPALVRDAAAVLRFGHGDGETRDVVKALAHEEPEVRIFAARAAALRFAAGTLSDDAPRLRSALRDALPDADISLQLALIEALGAAPEPADRAALMALLQDESTRVRVEAAAALAR